MLFLALLCQDGFAIPNTLSQQGRLIDNNDAPIEGTHYLTFRIFDSNIATIPLWEETLSVNFINGYYGATLGENINNQLHTDLFATQPLFLEMQIGSETPFFPRQLLSSMPYSLRSKEAISVDGGNVNASQIEVGGVVVIDSSGSWVGPTIDMNWTNIQGIPQDFADGVDNDTVLSENEVEDYITNGALDLAEGSTIGGKDLQEAISCQDGQILRWDGVLGWDCSEDSVLDSDDVLGYVTQNPIDLAGSSSVAGKNIVTQHAPCNNGEILVYDFASSSWICGTDQDTNTQLSADEIVTLLTDRALQLANGTTVNGSPVLTENSSLEWSNLNNVPSGLQDGDDNTQLTTADVISAVESSPVTLASGSTLDGSILIVDPGCADEQVLQYNATSQTWNCVDFSSNLDKDGDGVFAWEDCNDNDASNDNNSSTDADCDGVPTSADCDDFDPSNLTNKSTDADCDGVPTSADCDDNNSAAFDANGKSIGCAANSCSNIISSYPTSEDGMYWLTIGSNTEQYYCDMTNDDGGWTLITRISVDSNSDDWFKNHPNFLNDVTGKNASKVMWKAFSDTSSKSINGDDPLWAITTVPQGSYTVDTAYQMTERGGSWRISGADRSTSLDFYSVIGNVSCSSSGSVHIDHGSTGNKAEIATFYGCSWDGQSSYSEYLLYVYTTHNGTGYFSRAFSNGSFTGSNEIMAYELFIK